VYEEPVLRATFGAEYEAFRAALLKISVV